MPSRHVKTMRQLREQTRDLPDDAEIRVVARDGPHVGIVGVVEHVEQGRVALFIAAVDDRTGRTSEVSIEVVDD
jgi:hypothetical protein